MLDVIPAKTHWREANEVPMKGGCTKRYIPELHPRKQQKIRQNNVIGKIVEKV